MKHLAPVILLCVTPLAATAARAGLVQNTSFEYPGESRADSPRATNWVLRGEWLRRETGWQPRHWGPCMIGYHHWRVTEAEEAGFHQVLSGVPETADWEFKVHAFKDQKANAEYVELRIEPAGGGKPLAARRYAMKDIPGDVWTELTVGTRLQEGAPVRLAVTILPSRTAPRDGALKFDDASLVKKGTPLAVTAGSNEDNRRQEP